MIGYFPEPYPDELFYSLCARFGDRMQYRSKVAATRDLFGKGVPTAIVDLPSHLGLLVEALPPGHLCKDAARLIDDHTLLPFYGPFQPVERIERVRQVMLGTKGATIYAHVGLLSSPIQRPTSLRYCSLCVEEDRERFGECYWHRIHQVPGVEVCPVHEVTLEASGVRARKNRTRHEFVAAERAIQETVAPTLSFAVSVHQHLLDIARAAAWLLKQRSLAAGPQLLYHRYKLLLIDRGLASSRGAVKTRILIQSFKACYPSELLTLVRCDISEQARENWLTRLTRTSKASQHPLQHLLLIRFLGCTAEDFFALPTDPQPAGSGLSPSSQRLGMDRSTPTLQTSTADPPFRPWLPHRAPSKSATRLVPPRVNWAERDERLAGEVQMAVQYLKQISGRPVRISADAIGRQVGEFRALHSERGRLPLTSKVLAELVESHDAFAVRRIQWAAQLYQDEGVYPKRWELMARAGINTRYLSQWPLAQEALESALQALSSQSAAVPKSRS